MVEGILFDLQRYSLHDGSGIRTLVFLKGCPLNCLWCANPESQSGEPEILFDARRCKACGACLDACPSGAIRQDPQGRLLYDRRLCRGCGACARACPHQARRLAGTRRTFGDLLEEVERDAPFFRRTGGGVTLSGGEPLQQAAFAAAFLRACRGRGIHTAMETSGCAPWPAVAEVAPHVDQFLFDLKVMDPGAHERFTGASNGRILENLERLCGIHGHVVVRYPLIPGYNDQPSQIKALAGHVKGLGGVERIEVLPYHRYGEHKYGMLGRAFPTAGVALPAPGEVDRSCALVRAAGLECRALH